MNNNKKLSQFFILKEARNLTVELNFDEWALIKDVLQGASAKDPIARMTLKKLEPQINKVDPHANTAQHQQQQQSPPPIPDDAVHKSNPNAWNKGLNTAQSTLNIRKTIDPKGVQAALNKNPGLHQQKNEPQSHYQSRISQFANKMGDWADQDADSEDDMPNWDQPEKSKRNDDAATTAGKRKTSPFAQK